ETKAAIKEVFEEYSYLMDTHTAVAYKVYKDYKAETGDDTKTIVASTANPYKFGKAVYEALGQNPEGMDEFTIIEKLEAYTGTKMPAPLAATKDKKVRFSGSVGKLDMSDVVLNFLTK
ncbi:MAG: threonine synthase, partial [Ruminiclostridium sp.]